MKRATLLVVACVAGLIATAGQVQSAMITAGTSATEWDLAPIGDDLDDITLTLSGLPTNPISDLTATFRIRADFDLPIEFVTLSIDGFSFGNWLNNNLGDDTITDSVNDSGGNNGSAGQNLLVFRGTATIPQAIFSTLIADGQLSATFNFSPDVDDLANPPFNGFERPEHASFGVSYTAAPEPTSLAIFGIGASLLGLGAARRRRREKNLSIAA